LIRKYAGLPGRIFTVAYTQDGSRIAAGSSHNGKGEVRIYQEADAKQVSKLEGERGPVYTLAFHPSGRQIASAGFDGVVRINDVQTGKLITEFVPCPVE
jgi:WD40 repeat protein